MGISFFNLQSKTCLVHKRHTQESFDVHDKLQSLIFDHDSVPGYSCSRCAVSSTTDKHQQVSLQSLQCLRMENISI